MSALICSAASTHSRDPAVLGVSRESSRASRLTFTPGGLAIPVAAEQADAAGDSPELVPSVAAVFACRAVVVSIRVAADVTVQRRKQSRASSHWTGNQRQDARTILRWVWTQCVDPLCYFLT